MAQRLRALAVFPKDPGSIPSSHCATEIFWSQRTTWWIWVFPSAFTWVLGTKLRTLACAAVKQVSFPLSHLAGLVVCC